MKQWFVSALILSSLVVVGCAKKGEQAAENGAPAPQQETAATPPVAESAPVAEPSEQDAERAEKQALMDYATMEDTYINDPSAQWATTAKASSTFGDDDGKPSDSSLASNVIGATDGKTWTNNRQDMGMDWLEVGFAKPVVAKEVRVVFQGGDGVEAVSKVELQDPQGKWNTVWSGISDMKEDERGRRTWFVRSFEKTSYPVSAAKITIANNLERGYKVIDAVQLVSE
jgi:hypothetical protein